VVPVQSEKSSHIDALVQKQKLNPSQRSSKMRPTARRSCVKVPPQTNSRNYSSNYNSIGDMKESLQQRICKIVQKNPKVM
jgi:hypothetical protein